MFMLWNDCLTTRLYYGLSNVEDAFSVNLAVYSVETVEGRLHAQLIHRSSDLFTDNLSFIRHMCYVRDMSKIIHDYICDHCHKSFPRMSKFKGHVLTCTDREVHKYTGGPTHSGAQSWRNWMKRALWYQPSTVSIHIWRSLILSASAARRTTSRTLLVFSASATTYQFPSPFPAISNQNLSLLSTRIPDLLVKDFVVALETLAGKSKTHIMERLGKFLAVLEGIILGVEQELRTRAAARVLRQSPAIIRHSWIGYTHHATHNTSRHILSRRASPGTHAPTTHSFHHRLGHRLPEWVH